MACSKDLQSHTTIEPANAPHAPFKYDGLDSELPLIRLLTLDTKGKDIICKLETVDLRQNPQYEALSYSWETQSDKCSIILNGSPFNVGQNLYGALKVLKSISSLGEPGEQVDHQDERKLWIDAICINQEDLDERSHQVQLMWDIYARSTRVLIWLGDERDDGHIGMEMVRLLALHHELSFKALIANIMKEQDLDKEQHVPSTSNAQTNAAVVESPPGESKDEKKSMNFFMMTGEYKISTGPVSRRWSFPGRDNDNDGPKRITDDKELSNAPFHMLWSVASAKNAADPEPWVAFQKLFERSWWQRVWTIQEVAAARDNILVGCGSSWLNWTKFVYAQQCVELSKNMLGLTRLHRLGAGMGAVKDKYVLSVRKDGRLDSWAGLMSLLDSSLQYHATDPRDRIYAILGFAPSVQIVPDYTIKVELLFQNFVRMFIRETGSLGILCMNRHPKILNLPSWVPDFSLSLPPSAYNNRCPMGYYGADGNNWHNLGSFNPSCLVSSTDKQGELSIGGFIYDSVLECGATFDSATVSDAIETMNSYLTLLREVDSQHYPTKYCCSKSREAELRRTIIWNASATDRYPVDEVEFSTAYSDLLHDEHYVLPLDDDEISKQKISTDKHREYRAINNKGSKAGIYYDAFIRNGLNRKFFVTKRGLLGSGPPEMQIGDIICILLGMKTPVVLRRVVEENIELDEEKQKGMMIHDTGEGEDDDDAKVEEKFNWIGHVFVHGIMHGEALSAMDTVSAEDGRRELAIKMFCLV